MKENRFCPEDLIRDIHACTPVYLERLLGRHALFVPGDGSVSMEALYKAANFMNLCGVHYENISPKDFWEMALKSYLTPDGLLPNRTCVATRTNQDTTASTSRSPPTKARHEALKVRVESARPVGKLSGMRCPWVPVSIDDHPGPDIVGTSIVISAEDPLLRIRLIFGA